MITVGFDLGSVMVGIRADLAKARQGVEQAEA